MRTAFISHPDCRKHRLHPEHPECSARLDAISDRVLMSGLDLWLSFVEANSVTHQALARVHDERYLLELAAAVPTTGIARLDMDTELCPESLNAARRAAGAGITALEHILSGKIDAAFCSVRPPGHHATRNQAMGFCLYNNVAVVAAEALARGLERVTIVDFDVHHGNGTEAIFADEPRVQLCSSFQSPLYPNTEFSTDNPHILNLPLPAVTKSHDYRQAVAEHWFAAIAAFKPQLIIISAGFDGHVEDEMSAISLTEYDYGWLTEQLVGLAKQHDCLGIISCLEGGYELSALARSVEHHLKALLELR